MKGQIVIDIAFNGGVLIQSLCRTVQYANSAVFTASQMTELIEFVKQEMMTLENPPEPRKNQLVKTPPLM